MFFVYLLQHTATKEIYIGYTNNVKRRLQEHNTTKGTSTSRKEGTWILIYCEAYKSQTDAMSREKKLKHHGSGKHELLKRIQGSLLA
jgi:putative endonuclease